MGEIKGYLLGALLVSVVIAGFFSVFNEWFAANNVASLDTTTFNQTAINANITDWANKTSAQLYANSQVQFVGGTYAVTTGVFQAITFILTLPATVIFPLLTGILGLLGLPSWFVGFALAAVLFSIMFALIKFLKGGLDY